MYALLAQSKTTLPHFEGIGPLGNPLNIFGGTTDPTLALDQFERTLSVVIGILTISAGIWFIFQIFAGAYQWLASGGEKQGIENARKRITNAIIGLFVVVASYLLIGLVGKVFGIDILVPSTTIKNL